MHHVASAALPVAIGLLVCAAAARAVLWWGLGDVDLQRTARDHVEPLCLWCLGVLVVYFFARSASGGALLTTAFLGAALSAPVLALWQAGQDPATEERRVEEPPPAEQPPAPDDSPRQGLWSRGLSG
jgi:hypothetical protein